MCVRTHTQVLKPRGAPSSCVCVWMCVSISLSLSLSLSFSPPPPLSHSLSECVSEWTHRAVNKDGVALDACQQIRGSNDADSQFFAGTPPGMIWIDDTAYTHGDRERAHILMLSSLLAHPWV